MVDSVAIGQTIKYVISRKNNFKKIFIAIQETELFEYSK
jgi:hypothetical protein